MGKIKQKTLYFGLIALLLAATLYVFSGKLVEGGASNSVGSGGIWGLVLFIMEKRIRRTSGI
jgi:hypothetical protein